MTAGSTEIAHTERQYVGGGDCGWLFYTLTAAGKSILAHARGNQLPPQVTVTNGGQTGTAQFALVRFG